MEWSAETASHKVWSGLDKAKAGGEVRLYLKKCLREAWSAGYSKGQSAAEYDDTNADNRHAP